MDKTQRKLDSICRLCLSENEKHFISASALINASLSAQDVERFTGIRISQNECVSYAFCIDCGEKLENSVHFRKLCIRNDTLFRQLFSLKVEITPQDDRNSVTLSPKTVTEHADEIEEPGMKSNATASHSDIKIEILDNLRAEEKQNRPSVEHSLHEGTLNEDEAGEAYNETSGSSPLERHRNHSPDRFIDETDERADCVEDLEKDVHKQHPNGLETSHPAKIISCPSKARRRNSQANYSCSYCAVDMTLKSNLQHHIKNLHARNTSKTCSLCGETFSSYHTYKHHKASQHGNPEYKTECNICSKTFSNVTAYNKHCGRYHATADEKNRPKTKKKQLCGICGMMVTQLSAHSLTHSQEKHLACPHCPIKMADKGNLSRHIQAVHLKKVVRTCETCGKEFLHVNLYKYHMLSVHGIGKTFDCDICLKQFKTLAVLKIHKVSLHSNEKRFACSTCGMMFKVKHTLRTHETRVHSVEKPFACSQCPKRFKSPYGKKSHELTHSGIVFSCSFCEKVYRYKSLLQTHTRKHHSKMEETNMKD